MTSRWKNKWTFPVDYSASQYWFDLSNADSNFFYTEGRMEILDFARMEKGGATMFYEIYPFLIDNSWRRLGFWRAEVPDRCIDNYYMYGRDADFGQHLVPIRLRRWNNGRV